jgi:DNA helicase II / ATP-dependent DNA helicase PcrA
VPVPGPPSLGRGVVVRRGDPIPPPWADAERIEIDAAALAAPEPVVVSLHDAWSARRPVVVVLAVDAEQFRPPVSIATEPWRLHAGFEIWHDRLHFLVWANTYDARDGIAPVWWWARKAARLGGSEVADDLAADPTGDVVLADGTPVWVDGGPRGGLDAAALGAGVVHRESVELGRLVPEPPPALVRAALAPDQLAAVAHGAGPARIVAPAGSGKTRVLTERLRHVIVDRGVERETVMAVAYNKKAQLELEERTADFRPRVSTLNALGFRLLAEHAGRPVRVLDEREVRRIIDDLVPSRQRRANTDPIAPYLEGLAAVRLGLRDPMSVELERDDVPGLAEAFGRYRRAMASAGAVDFDEQVYGAIEVLLGDGEFRRRAQAGFRHLLVDEFQDLTPAHVLLLRLLAAPGLDVFGVGDDDQVIYGYVGADPGFLIDFEQLFPGAGSHPLEINYRCPIAVVDAARTLLSYNHRRVAKEIRPGPAADADERALVVLRHPPETGARSLVELVQEWLGAVDVAPADVAVLTRVNSLLLAPHVALVGAGVPVSSTLSADVLQRTGVRAALAYLRLGTTPERLKPDDLQEVLRRPSRGFPQWIGKWLGRPMSIDELRALADRIDDLKVGAKLVDFADDLALVARAVASGTTREALAVVADQIGLAGAMSLLDVSKGGQTGSSLDDLDALAQVADLHPAPATFEQWLRGVLKQPMHTDGVTLSTIHRVKGMEWDRVAVFGVTSGVLPHRLADDEEEERRVLHVGITRGRHRVAVLADASRPSPFLGELDGSAPQRRPRAAAAAALAPARTAPARATLAPLADLPPEVGQAEEVLRSWRLERSRADKVPAYVVLSNAVLRAVAVRRPASLVELAQISGIGPTKLDLYGDDIIALLDALAPPPS